MEQLRSLLVKTSNQQSHTKWSAHDGLLSISTLAESQGKIANSLGAALNSQGLVVVEGVALRFDAGVLDHGTSVGLQTGHGAANVAIDLDNLLDGRGFEERGGYSLLDSENDTF